MSGHGIAGVLRRHSVPDPWRSLFYIAVDWGIIAASIALGSLHAWAWVLAAPVIGGRQHALFVLLHDGAHQRLSSSRRVNEWLGDWACGFAILMGLEAYRRNHLAHHQHTNTAQDPDWVRKEGRRDWEFPMPEPQLTRSVMRYLWGFGVLEMCFAVPVLSGLRSADPVIRRRGALRVGAWLWVAALLVGVGAGGAFLKFWLVPYFVFFPLYNRVRSVAEHFGMERRDDYSQSRNVVGARWWEKLTVAPHGVHYHLAHHLYPSVCHFRLKEFHEALLDLDPAYRQQGHHTLAYFPTRQGSSVWREAAPPRSDHSRSDQAQSDQVSIGSDAALGNRL